MFTADLFPFDPCDFLQMTAVLDIGESHLELNYFLRGETERVLLQSKGSSGQRLINLWDHTCFEFFMAPSEKKHYWEFNFSPTGAWNCFRLEDYRKDATYPEITVPVIRLEEKPGLIFLQAVLNIPGILSASDEWDIQFATVIKLTDSSLQYWSNSHFCDEPDYHSRRNFINQIKKSDF